jgi:hypothetical protein
MPRMRFTRPRRDNTAHYMDPRRGAGPRINQNVERCDKEKC